MAGFALGSWLLGLPFTAITFFGLQEARRVWPSAGTASPGCSPPLTVWARSSAPHGGLDAAPRRHAQPGLHPGLVAAAAALVLGAALYAVMVALAVAGPAEFARRALFRQRQRQAQHKAGTATGVVLAVHAAVVPPGDGPHQRQPRPTPPERSLAPGRR